MKKFLILGVVTVVALASLAVGYALWSKTLYISGTVNTGTVDIGWSPVTFEGDSEPVEKDYSDIDCTIIDDTIYVDVYDAYPSIWYACSFDVTSTGTVPVHFYPIEWTGLPLTGVDVVLAGGAITGLDPAPAQQSPVPFDFAGVQLHQGDSQDLTIYVHFANEADLPQGTDNAITFSGTLVGGQWNEIP
jgi:hypothetical protein